jgi:ABC-2 type transport system ATP-binding protein
MTTTASHEALAMTMTQSAPHAVAFDGVTRRFGATTALDSVDLRIEPGETVALLGPNGAGKSTAISIMLGLRPPSAGSARTMGLEPRDAVLSGRVGAMLQAATLPVGATVGELVDLARSLYPNPTPRAAVLERAGLTALAGRRVETLSGGEAQRVRFALAIAGDPDLVFLDEPTVAMDVESRRAFWADMRAAAAQGRTILFATHFLDEADSVADRIVVLAHGRVVADDSPAALKARVTERRIRFDWAPTADGDGRLAHMPGVRSVERHGPMVELGTSDADTTVRALVAADIDFRALEVTGADLDTAFLALTGGVPDADAA